MPASYKIIDATHGEMGCVIVGDFDWNHGQGLSGLKLKTLIPMTSDEAKKHWPTYYPYKRVVQIVEDAFGTVEYDSRCKQVVASFKNERIVFKVHAADGEYSFGPSGLVN